VNTLFHAIVQTLSLKKNKYIYIYIFLLSLLQLAFINAYLPVEEWFTSIDAIYEDDFSYHYGDVLDKIAYIKEFGKIWAYNPFVRAGSISSVINTIDSNGWFLFCFSLFFLPVEISFKLYFILGILMVPILCYKTARNFDITQGVSLLCSLMGTLLMHVSIMVNFLNYGSCSFVFASYISILTLSYFYCFCLRGKLKDLICFTLLLIWALWIHGFTVVILCVPLLICYVLYFRRMGWLLHLNLLISLLLTGLANILWLYPLIDFLDHAVKNTASIFYSTDSLIEPLETYLFRNNRFNSNLLKVFRKEEWVDIILLLSALLGMYLWNKNRERLKAALFFGAFVCFFLLSYYGSFFEITRITPMRFLITLNIFLIFPSAVAVHFLYRFFLGDKSHKVKIASSAVLVYLLIALLATPYNHIFIKKDFRQTYKVPEQFHQLVLWIKKNTSKEGRILIENSCFESRHQYYGTHLPSLLPEWTDREYIGNYNSYGPTKDNFVSYNAGKLFRNPVGTYSQAVLRSYLDLYNIRWIVYWSKGSKKVFNPKYKYYTYLTRIDKFHICRVERNPTFFIKGDGSVSARQNEIHLQNVKPVGGEVILSYHWMKHLKTDPPRKIERVFLMNDPIGFIKIKDPPPSIVVYNSY